MPVLVRSYPSPTLVLLTYDWPAAEMHSNFLGFGIERTPGFGGEPRSWLRRPRPLPVEGKGPDADAPIRTFYCWDARIDASDRGARFHYRVVPLVGPEGSMQPLDQEAGLVEVLVP